MNSNRKESMQILITFFGGGGMAMRPHIPLRDALITWTSRPSPTAVLLIPTPFEKLTQHQNRKINGTRFLGGVNIVCFSTTMYIYLERNSISRMQVL